jgi:hypothetical protein
MPNLNEYIGSIISSITNARVMADIQTVKVAEEYAKHDLLKHFAIPRMRVGDVELTIPVALDALTEKTQTEYQPIDNTKFNSLMYKELTNSLGLTSLPSKASKALRSQLAQGTHELEQSLRIGQDITPLNNYSQLAAQQLIKLADEFNLVSRENVQKLKADQIAARVAKVAEQEIKVLSQRSVIENLNVIAESHKLREEKPENIIYIKLKITEDGMEWQQMQNSDGETSRRLLPE